MKNVILYLLKRAGITLSGPLGWVASILIDRLAVFLEKKIREAIKFLKDKAWLDSEKKKDEKNGQKLKDVLESDTKTESEIDEATSDHLNGR